MSPRTRRGPPPPAPEAGFESLARYWDPRLHRHMIKLLPGEFGVTRSGEVLVTVLGSCVSACIRDPATGLAGMNHFMLPEPGEGAPWAEGRLSLAERYGSHAMESLINALLVRGARRERLEVKLFGGGRVLEAMTDIGARNAAWARAYLVREGFPLLADDLGGERPRKVYYDPLTGRVRVRSLRSLHNDTLLRREASYRSRLAACPLEGAVELFE